MTGGKLVSFEDYVYYFGGIETGAVYSSNVYKYDPVADTWSTALTGILWKNAYMPQGNFLYNNSAYFFGHQEGGIMGDEIWEYNFVDNTMERLNAGRGEVANVGAQASMIDKEMVIVGGYDSTTLSNNNRVMKYDITTDTWKTNETLHSTYIQKAGGAIVTFSNAVYILAGMNNDRNPTNSTFVYFV